jgi:DNA-binding XRE family transcriptional regulator
MWDYDSEEQKRAMEETITAENCGKKLKLVREVSGLSRKELADIIGCSETTVFRLETEKSKPTEEFIYRLRALTVIGYHKFKALSDAEKATLGETLGAAGGVATGVAGSIAAVSAAGSVAGLSAAGITSGLAAIGGGSLLGGIGVVAAMPVAVGLAGYGLVKGIQAICFANDLACKEVDGRYEIVATDRTSE